MPTRIRWCCSPRSAISEDSGWSDPGPVADVLCAYTYPSLKLKLQGDTSKTYHPSYLLSMILQPATKKKKSFKLQCTNTQLYHFDGCQYTSLLPEVRTTIFIQPSPTKCIMAGSSLEPHSVLTIISLTFRLFSSYFQYFLAQD